MELRDTCPTSFEFRDIIFLDWLPINDEEHSLPYYLNHEYLCVGEYNKLEWNSNSARKPLEHSSQIHVNAHNHFGFNRKHRPINLNQNRQSQLTFNTIYPADSFWYSNVHDSFCLWGVYSPRKWVEFIFR